jgi:hypothetical protein
LRQTIIFIECHRILGQAVADTVAAAWVVPAHRLLIADYVAGAALQACLIYHVQPLCGFIKAIAVSRAGVDAGVVLTGLTNIFIQNDMRLFVNLKLR